MTVDLDHNFLEMVIFLNTSVLPVDLKLKVNKDRLILHSIQYFLDIFFPIDINPSQTTALWCKSFRSLKLTLPFASL